MNYNSLFNLLYSTEISEDTKTEIISKIEEPIEEAHEVQPLIETYLELLDTLVFSTASEALIYNIIDETFNNLDEEFINEVSDEWVKRKVQDSMAARKSAADNANRSVKGGVIGLSQIRRQDKAQQDLAKGQAKANSIQARLDKRTSASEPKVEGAVGGLKSAVGKVKKWASGENSAAPVGLSRIIGAKANKDNIGAETLRQQTTHKEEAPKTEVKTPEVKAEAPKAQTVAAKTISGTKSTSPTDTLKKAQEIGDRIHKQVQDDIKKMDKEQAKRDKADQKEVEKRQKNFEKLTAKTKATQAAKKEAASKTEEVQAPEVKAEVKADDATKAVKKTAKKTSTKTTSKAAAKKTEEVKPAEEAPKIENKKTEEIPQEVSKVENKQPIEDKKVEEVPKPQTETPNSKAKSKSTGGVSQKTAAKIKDMENTVQFLKDRRAGMTAKPGYDENAVKDLDDRIAKMESKLNKLKVNEAFSNFAVLLLNTNISESCFVDVMEMIAVNKENALKFNSNK